MEPIIVIPAYQPTAGLESVIDTILQTRPEQKIVVVDDGCSPIHAPLFERLLSRGVICLKHAVNLGKGQALKTAMNHILNTFPTTVGIVTADADGQHLAKDILATCDKLSSSPNTLWVGARAFDKAVPLRSQFGNTVTRHVFRLLVGCALQDTQSGLRGIPRHFLPSLLKITSARYEFELDMLVEAAQQKIAIKELPIETVYLENNASSHFRPLLDSLRIYFVFIRFCALSIITALLDFIVFSISFWFGASILASFLLARAVAGSFNFLLGKRWIFKSKASIWPEALKFTMLVLVLMSLSYVLVNVMNHYLGINVIVSKFIAECGLFLLSFAAQRLLVFGRTANPAIST